MAIATQQGLTMSVEVRRLVEVQRNLLRMNRELAPGGGLSHTMQAATFQTHRYLLSLARSGTPPTQRGVLPVVTGRLRGSLFWAVRSMAQWAEGRIYSNVGYSSDVEGRRGFMDKTTRDQRQVVFDTFNAFARRVTNGR